MPPHGTRKVGGAISQRGLVMKLKTRMIGFAASVWLLFGTAQAQMIDNKARGNLQNWIARLIVSVPSRNASSSRGCATPSMVLTLVMLRAPTPAALAISCRTSIRGTFGKFA